MKDHWYVKSKCSGGIRVAFIEDQKPRSMWFETKEQADEWIQLRMSEGIQSEMAEDDERSQMEHDNVPLTREELYPINCHDQKK